jgi:hypothetical protein
MPYDFQPSGTPKPIEPTGFFTGIKFRPILTGAVVDYIATFVLSAFYYGFYVAPNSGAAAAFEEEAAKFWMTSEGLAAGLLLGSLGTLIGGFYAAYKAGNLQMKHGALVGVTSIIVGVVMHSGDSTSEFPEWFMALSFAAAIPAGALGGFFAEMFAGMTGKNRQ